MRTISYKKVISEERYRVLKLRNPKQDGQMYGREGARCWERVTEWAGGNPSYNDVIRRA